MCSLFIYLCIYFSILDFCTIQDMIHHPEDNSWDNNILLGLFFSHYIQLGAWYRAVHYIAGQFITTGHEIRTSSIVV